LARSRAGRNDGHGWLDAALAAAAGLFLCWLVLVGVLAAGRPRGPLLKEALRLLPDLLRPLRRLAADRNLSWTVRVRIVLLMIYLALPIDLIPDVIPVLGYADDAIIVTLILRGVVRRAGLDAVSRHWPGTDDGFVVLTRLTGLTQPVHQPVDP
jgi:uncharacterized membrane protein YkvA (DUF1232 family)